MASLCGAPPRLIRASGRLIQNWTLCRFLVHVVARPSGSQPLKDRPPSCTRVFRRLNHRCTIRCRSQTARVPRETCDGASALMTPWG